MLVEQRVEQLVEMVLMVLMVRVALLVLQSAVLVLGVVAGRVLDDLVQLVQVPGLEDLAQLEQVLGLEHLV